MAGGLIEVNLSTKGPREALLVDVDTYAQSWDQSKGCQDMWEQDS